MIFHDVPWFSQTFNQQIFGMFPIQIRFAQTQNDRDARTKGRHAAVHPTPDSAPKGLRVTGTPVTNRRPKEHGDE